MNSSVFKTVLRTNCARYVAGRYPTSRRILSPQNLTMTSRRFYNSLENYIPPPWAAKLKNVPSHKIRLAQLNTPIHKWELPGAPEGFEIYIKRDDMTGSSLSGNKVRKLEFLLADAVNKECKHVITCGGIQSNHCRATAVAARQLGMKPHLVLRSDVQTPEAAGCSGNLLLNRLVGADLYFVPKLSSYEKDLKPRMEVIAKDIEQKTGENAYHICVGGSDSIGLYGYLDAFHEMEKQGVLEDFDDIVFACGSGGTAEGLSIGNYLTGSKLRIHGIIVSDGAPYFYNHINKHLPMVGLESTRAEDIVDIVEGYKGKGYGISSQEQLDFNVEVSRKTGIVLDTVYTGKGVHGFVQELNKNPRRFKGTRILYIHTGGIFGLLDGTINETLMNDSSSKTYMWPEMDESPLLGTRIIE